MFSDVLVSKGLVNGFGLDVLPDSILEVIAPWGDNAAEGRIVPLVPIWGGFVLNALIFGAMSWWALPRVLAFVKSPRAFVFRRWRVRRGLCLACGYDRAELADDAPCPECGAHPA